MRDGFILDIVCLDDMFPHPSSVYRFQRLPRGGSNSRFCMIAGAMVGQVRRKSSAQQDRGGQDRGGQDRGEQDRCGKIIEGMR